MRSEEHNTRWARHGLAHQTIITCRRTYNKQQRLLLLLTEAAAPGAAAKRAMTAETKRSFMLRYTVLCCFDVAICALQKLWHDDAA